MAATLSDKTIDLVKATVPALEAHGLAITQPHVRSACSRTRTSATCSTSRITARRLAAQGARRGRDRLCAQHRQPRRARLPGGADRPEARRR